MNMEFIIANASQLLVVVAVICNCIAEFIIIIA